MELTQSLTWYDLVPDDEVCPPTRMCNFGARQDVNGNRVMAGFIGEVLAACLRFRFDLLCFQEILI